MKLRRGIHCQTCKNNFQRIDIVKLRIILTRQVMQFSSFEPFKVKRKACLYNKVTMLGNGTLKHPVLFEELTG